MIYFDNCASAKPFDEVLIEAAKISSECFFNASSTHFGGLQAQKLIAVSRETLAKRLSCKAKEIVFASGGTECNNLAVFGAQKNKKGRIVSSKLEHPSVLNCVLELQKQGFSVDFVRHLRSGEIDIEHFQSLLGEDLSFVSICHVNGEIGEINDIKTLAYLAKKSVPNAVFHSDGVQAFGKLPVNLGDLGIDLYSVSAHKIGGLRGAGALFARENLNLKPCLFGGGQENGLRSGTENVAAIATFCGAFDLFAGRKKQLEEVSFYLKDRLLKSLEDNKIKYILNGKNTLCSILNVAFENVKSEVLMQILSKEGVYVSKGSACSSRAKVSRLAEGLKLPPKFAEGILRVSTGVFNTKEECDSFAEILIEAIKKYF